jgi:hypothetical protein
MLTAEMRPLLVAPQQRPKHFSGCVIDRRRLFARFCVRMGARIAPCSKLSAASFSRTAGEGGAEGDGRGRPYTPAIAAAPSTSQRLVPLPRCAGEDGGGASSSASPPTEEPVGGANVFKRSDLHANLHSSMFVLCSREEGTMSHRFGGPWTELKLDAVEYYLQCYTRALTYARMDIWYVDAFAGAGSSPASASGLARAWLSAPGSPPLPSPARRGKVAPKATEGGGHTPASAAAPPPAKGWSPSPATRERMAAA